MAALDPGADGVPVPALALVILDGWGLAEEGPGNAVALAETPVFDELWERYPRTTLSASGQDVGLPDGQMGNSEVGHLNLGAGSIVKQDLARIGDAIGDGSFFDNEALLAACERARSSPRGRLHLLGLVSDGGVHSGWEHIEACIEMAAREGVPDLVVHALTDGRDTSPSGGPAYLAEVERWLRSAGRIGTVSGRYYGMDRDQRWERTKLAFDAIVHAEGQRADDAVQAVRESHEAGETDEFVRPTVIGDYDGVADGDVIVTFNFRPDRMREIVAALGSDDFDGFDRGAGPFSVTTMTEYRSGWPYPVAFPPREPATTMAEVIDEAGGRQLHVAETEKYAHVTYFFNGGREREWGGEERRLVDSPRDVPTYDHKPEMSAEGAAAAFCDAWQADEFRFAIINFANPDMVGHTGDVDAAVRAIETVDACLARVVETVHGSGGACLITADHGNAEYMREPDGSPNTAHTTNPVPLIATLPGLGLDEGGILADISPAALAMLGIAQPETMTGRSLLTG
ncbi:MAG TPA: 2,3-bisphosphoglycerate-independent phosphoglycerate mutase [Solirubrobacterales bacterium]|nr:2,3-bisphosphoglycerate-independent phosphoglycerate mutase [Solirubrobacterales bacterium]